MRAQWCTAHDAPDRRDPILGLKRGFDQPKPTQDRAYRHVSRRLASHRASCRRVVRARAAYSLKDSSARSCDVVLLVRRCAAKGRKAGACLEEGLRGQHAADVLMSQTAGWRARNAFQSQTKSANVQFVLSLEPSQIASPS